MTATRTSKKELTGRHVLIMLIAFFGLIIAVNTYFISAAVTSFRGEDVKGSYRQGLEYNQTLKQREVQSRLEWTITANIIPKEANNSIIIVKFIDAAKAPIDGLTLAGTLRHPTDLAQDRNLEFRALGGGRYQARTEELAGSWQLRGAAQQGDTLFRFKYALQ